MEKPGCMLAVPNISIQFSGKYFQISANNAVCVSVSHLVHTNGTNSGGT